MSSPESPSPSIPNTASQTLQERLAALRQTSTSTLESALKVNTTSSDLNKSLIGTRKDEDDIAALLESLDTPGDDDDLSGDEDLDVSIQAKNVDDDVAKYLVSASKLPSTSSLPPISQSASQKRLESTLSTFEATAPSFVSPIEVSFFSPSTQTGPTRTLDEDELLIQRLRDELKVEAQVESRGAVQDNWQKRLDEMKQFKPATDPEKEKAYMANLGKQLGDAPDLNGLDKLERLRRLKAKTDRKRKSSDDDSEEEDSEDDDDTEDSDGDSNASQ